jgi:hypothetical protein
MLNSRLDISHFLPEFLS